VTKQVVKWGEAEEVVNQRMVHEYLENFANDPNYDNAVCLVILIMEMERNNES
jgi:hypothetical protein